MISTILSNQLHVGLLVAVVAVLSMRYVLCKLFTTTGTHHHKVSCYMNLLLHAIISLTIITITTDLL